MDISRKHIRFKPDDNTFLFIKTEEKTIHSGICLTESQGGCSGVFAKHDSLVDGASCIIKTGNLESMEAQIRWVKVLDEEVVKLGVQYLE